MNEEWKWVQGYEGVYQISNQGKLKSFHYKKEGYLMKPRWIIGNKGRKYLAYSIALEGIKETTTIHQFVARAFLPNPYRHPFVTHIDFDVTNNNVENLQWIDGANNQRRSTGYTYKATHLDSGEVITAHSRRHLAKLLGVSYGQIMYSYRVGKPLKMGYDVEIIKESTTPPGFK